jgi:hypothetical protein
MRTRVIVLSIVSAVAVVLLGSVLNFLGWFRFDYALPYNDPVVVVATLAGVAPGFIVGLIGLGVALSDAARRGGGVWFIALLAWPFVPVLAAALMFTGVLAHATSWFVALAFVPLAPLAYALTAPSAGTAPTGDIPAAAPSRSRLAAFVGVLVLVVLGGAALLYPGLQGGSSVPPGAPALQVTQNGSAATCAGGTYPAITVTNAGKQALQWTANTQDVNVTATPSDGSLAPGASVTVSLGGATRAPAVIVQFRAGSQTAGTAKFGCQSGASGQ